MRDGNSPVAPFLSPLRRRGDREGSGQKTSNARWRFDSWLHWREGRGAVGTVSAPQAASYGASQAGAILRYSLGAKRSSFVFIRATTALSTTGETAIALGAGSKPVTRWPIVLHAEARVTEFAGDWSVRPAAYAVTELSPLKLTETLTAEAYAQAGYVGGDFATPFADGQMRVERRIVRSDGIEFHVGAGAWGGAQKGAARLDIGPTASVRFDLGKLPVRLSADYRIRAAGNAAPDTGPAITLSSGF